MKMTNRCADFSQANSLQYVSAAASKVAAQCLRILVNAFCFVPLTESLSPVGALLRRPLSDVLGAFCGGRAGGGGGRGVFSKVHATLCHCKIPKATTRS